MILDRATIKSHLLSDPKDLFNCSPLKIEDVIPSTYASVTLFSEGVELTAWSARRRGTQGSDRQVLGC